MDGKTKLDEAKLKAEFESSEDLQAEFGNDIKACVSFRRAEAQGRIRGRLGGVKSSEFGSGAAAKDEEALRQEFDASEDLKNEFGDVDAYLAFKRAEASGRTKVCTSVGVVAFSSSGPDPKEGRISDKEFCFSGASARTSEEII